MQDRTRANSPKPIIIRELLRGKTCAVLAKIFNPKTVYQTYNELIKQGALTGASVDVPDEPDEDMPPEELFPDTEPSSGFTASKSTRSGKGASKSADSITLNGQPTLPFDVAERIRGILGISARPKVLSMPMPEMLYPAMVIATAELGFPAMRPEDFIDTVLYQWLEGCGYIPRAYIKKSDLDKLIEKPSIEDTERVALDYAKQHSLVSVGDFIDIMAERLKLPREDVIDIFNDTHNGDNGNHNGHNGDDEPVALQNTDEAPVKDIVNSVVAEHIVIEEKKPDIVIPTTLEKLTSDVSIAVENQPPKPEPPKVSTPVYIPQTKGEANKELLKERLMNLYQLSPQDIKVLELLARNVRMGDIATQVGIDVKGMVGTFSRIFHKMGVANGIYASNKYDELKQAIEQNG